MGYIECEELAPDQVSQIKQAISVARRAIVNARRELEIARDRYSPLVGRYFKIFTTKAEDHRDLDKIMTCYNYVERALLGQYNLVFDGELTGPAFGLSRIIGMKVAAYVPAAVKPGSGKEGVVKMVRSRAFLGDSRQLAYILIHELCHLYGGCDIDEYHGELGGAIRIVRVKALRNADSYAFFAIPPPEVPSMKVQMPPTPNR